jgi:DNA-binding LacI/PurR family transcriptional regulator
MAVTQHDVAVRAGVSRPLVSLVMRNSPHVSEQKREAVLRAASELGYRLNAHAAQLASRRSMNLGFILAEVENPIFLQVLKSAEDMAESQGYAVLLSASSLDAAVERSAVDRLLGHRVDGIVLVGTRLPSREVQELAGTLPVVTVSRRIAGVDAVSVDDRAGAEAGVQHLLDLGHRRVAHIDGGSGPGARLRRRGYEEVMTRCGLAGYVEVVRGDYTEPGGVTAAERLLSRSGPPTAIFTANDLMALGVMGVARRLGLRIPDDLSVVGFDNSPMSAFDYIGLTSVVQAPDELGADAVSSLIRRIQDPREPIRTTLVSPTLCVRGTTAPPSGPATQPATVVETTVA